MTDLSGSVATRTSGQAPAGEGRAAPAAAQSPAGESKVPLAAMAEEAHRELAMRHRVYPGLVKRGKILQSEADAWIHTMRAMRDALLLFAEYEPFVRDAIREAIAMKRACAEAETDPEVAAVRDAFPGSQVTGVRDLESKPGTPR